jgi:serine/threonine protein kinase
VEEELLARYQLPHGDMPSLGEYCQRFSNRPEVVDLIASRFLAGERYVRLQKLGLGAMGEVSQAYDRHLRRMVAVKQLRLGLRDEAETLRDFVEETRIAARLEHPGIVDIHEYHEEKNPAPFYVMRLVTGQTFSERIRQYHHSQSGLRLQERRRQWDELIRSMLAIVEAISHAHKRGVLHCDLKPGNIMVGEFGETVIVDWGMARRIGFAAGRSSQPVSSFHEAGTPDYMPPEQVDGIADERSDVFGLGAVLYELLTASSPHGWPDGLRPADWRDCVRKAHFERPRRRQPHTPPALEAICLRALEPAPERRYQTAADLGQDLKRYLAGEPLSIHQRRFSRIWPWMDIR